MSSCCCSLAGTSACRTCSNNPDADFNGVNKFYVTTDTTEVRIEPYIKTSEPKVNKDLVEVVRCRDCVYWDDWEDERLKGWRYCAMIDTKTEGSWFCADGEKKDGKHDGTD